FTIVDATGRQTTASLINQVGTTAPPTPPTPPVATTLTVNTSPANVSTIVTVPSCTASSNVSFTVQGGTPPYNFSVTSTTSPTTPTYNPLSQLLPAAGGFFISNLTPVSPSVGSQTFVSIRDSATSPQQQKVFTIV